MAAAGRRIGNRLPTDKENEKLLAGKSHMYVKNAKPRAALGDIGNQAVTKTFGKAGQNLGIANVDKRGLKAVGRSRATSALLAKPEPTLGHDVGRTKAEPMDLGVVAAALEECVAEDVAKVEDIDRADHGNPQLCSEYVNEIYEYMRKLEQKYKVRPGYMEGYPKINEKMRAILIDWLIQVHLRFGLLPETLYITVSLIDRFLQVHPVGKNELQLVGVSAMLLACKYEEMYSPEIRDFVYITDNAYSDKDIRKMEALIFSTLDFNLGKPLCLHFLRRNSKAGAVEPATHTMAKYFMELTLVDYNSVQFVPSQIAAAALYLSIKCQDNHSEWTPTLEHYSQYSEEQLMPCASRIAQLVLNANCRREKDLKSVYSKYAGSKLMQTSTKSCLRSAFIRDIAERS